MSLSLLQSTVPVEYEECLPGDGAVYNSYLCTPPRIYREEIQPTGILGFWYDETKDRFILLVRMSFALWPSWRINSYEIHPETGLVTAQSLGRTISGVLFHGPYTGGDFRRVYANTLAGAVANVDPTTLVVDASNPLVTSADVDGAAISRFVLNQTDRTIVLGRTGHVAVWNYVTNTRLGRISLPELFVNDLAYEDNDRCWAVIAPTLSLSNPGIVKLNYKKFVPELYTTLQPSDPVDVNTRIAYDSKRKNLGVFRQRANASDGAATHALEIYKPYSLPTTLTDPVPVQSVVVNQISTITANLVGDRGEVGQVKAVSVSNDGAGFILQPTVTPRVNGSITFQYQAAATLGDDTITLGVDL